MQNNHTTAEDIVRLLNLQPHPEGGFYRETYRCEEIIPNESLPDRYAGHRVYSTCIYYLLGSDDFSLMHRIKSDECFHFYMGDPVDMLLLHPNGTGECLTLGSNLEQGMHSQVIVKKGVWQGLKLKEGGSFALMGTTVAPGFDFADFETGDGKTLESQYPLYASQIKQLTRK